MKLQQDDSTVARTSVTTLVLCHTIHSLIVGAAAVLTLVLAVSYNPFVDRALSSDRVRVFNTI